MTKAVAIAILASFIALGVFGSLGVTHGTASDNLRCITEIIQGGVCSTNDTLGIISFHFSALQSFSSTTLDNGLLTLTLTIISIAAAMSILRRGEDAIGLYESSRIDDYQRTRETTFIPAEHSIRRDLSLKENSPSL